MSTYLKEAFQELKLLNEETFNITADGSIEMKDFLADNIDDVDGTNEVIIDPEADSATELEDSYIGNVVLKCEVCQSLIYKNPEEVIIDDETNLANEQDICPYCQSNAGYKIIGQITPFCENCEEPEVETEDDVNVEVEPKPEEEPVAEEEPFEDEEDEKLRESLRERILKNSTAAINEAKAEDCGCGDDCDCKGECKCEEECKKNLKEEIENITIETDKERINVSSEEKEEEIETGEEMIAPVTPEVEDKFEVENEEEEEEPIEDEFVDVDVDEFDEDDFDTLGEGYLKKVYENVEAYKTTKGAIDGNTLKLEGLITFKSGNKAKTNFVFEAKSITKTGLVKFLGENKQFAKGKKSFTLTGKMDGKKFITESFTYNYSAKDEATGKRQRLYGTIRK